MNLHFENLNELEQFIKYIGYVKADAPPKKTPKTPKKTEKPQPVETVKEPVKETVEEPVKETEALSHEDVLNFIRGSEAIGNNVNILLDSLEEFGGGKVSELPENKLAEFKATLIKKGA